LALLGDRAGPQLLLGTQLTPDYPPGHPLGFRYSLYQLALLLVMATGAGVGIWRGIPTWSYTWIVLAIISILILISALVPVFLAGTAGRGMVTAVWLVTSPFYAGGLLVLLFAASRVRRGLDHVFFSTAVYLAFLGLWVSIPPTGFFASGAPAVAALAITLAVTAIMLAVVTAMVVGFLHGDASTRRLSVYVLVSVALVAPIITGSLAPVLMFPELALSGFAATLVLGVLSRLAFVAAALLIVWALALWFIRIGKVPADTAASPSGETHAS
jgi:hypothetical protein